MSSRLVLTGALGAALLVPACSDNGDVAAPTTTSTSATSSTAAPATSSTTDTTSGSSTSSSQPSDTDAISVAVYWTRPYGMPPPIDVPGYQDPPSGPFPYVLYGSVTNTGAAIVGEVDVAWVLDGATVHSQSVGLRDPQTSAPTTLAPGATADLIVVVDDEAAAAQLADAVPTFEVGA
jgi:hypothetical protein